MAGWGEEVDHLAELLGISLEEYRTKDVHENNSKMEQTVMKIDTNEEEGEIKTTIDETVVNSLHTL